MLPRLLSWVAAGMALACIGFANCDVAQKPLASIDDLEKPLLVAVMGPTGSGKSSFINTILGRDRFQVGAGMASQTSQVEDELIQIDGRLMRLVDTPGFDDTNLTNTEVLDMIVTWMGIQYLQKTKFAGILYLRDITEFKMKGSDVKNLRMFRALCGSSGLENVIVVTTKWNMMTDQMETAGFREEQLKSDYLQPMLSRGADYARDYGTTRSSRTILRKVVQKNKAFYLDLQREIIDEGKSLREIAPGQVLQEELLKVEKKYQEDLERLGEELKGKYDEEIEEERREAAEHLERVKAAQEQLGNEYSKRFEEQEKYFRSMFDNLKGEYEEKMKTANDEEKEKLQKDYEQLQKALKKADQGDSSQMWNIAEKIIRSAAVTYSIHTIAAIFGIPPFLLQGVVHGAMHANINLTAATAMLPSVLSAWAKPLANLSELNLPISTFSRLGLKLSNISEWGALAANLSELASQYGSLETNFSDWQLRLSNAGDWALRLANHSEVAWQHYSAKYIAEFGLTSWPNISLHDTNWSELVSQYPKFSELRNRLLNLNLSDWKTHAANLNLSGMTSHLGNLILPQLGQAALTTGINFVLPLLLAQVVPKLGVGIGVPAAPQATAEIPQMINLNYYSDANGGAYKYDNIMGAQSDSQFTDWVMKGLGNMALPLIEYALE